MPLEVFIPERVDGFIPAEKNISQSRLANGATRLQPVTMLTGQAAGTIAALSVKQGIQPRALNAIQVQQALLESGCTLIQRWYADVPWGTEIWRATQLLALYEIMDRPGEIDRDNEIPLAAKARWGVDAEVSDEERSRVLTRLMSLTTPSDDHGGGADAADQAALPEQHLRAGDFAIAVARLLVASGGSLRP